MVVTGQEWRKKGKNDSDVGLSVVLFAYLPSKSLSQCESKAKATLL